MSSDLHSRLVRLAYDNPELRPQLLPLITARKIRLPSDISKAHVKRVAKNGVVKAGIAQQKFEEAIEALENAIEVYDDLNKELLPHRGSRGTMELAAEVRYITKYMNNDLDALKKILATNGRIKWRTKNFLDFLKREF